MKKWLLASFAFTILHFHIFAIHGYENDVLPSCHTVLLNDTLESINVSGEGKYSIFDAITGYKIRKINGLKVEADFNSQGLRLNGKLIQRRNIHIVPVDEKKLCRVNGVIFPGEIILKYEKEGLSVFNRVRTNDLIESILATQVKEDFSEIVIEALAIIARTNIYQASIQAWENHVPLRASALAYQGKGYSLQQKAYFEAIENTEFIILCESCSGERQLQIAHVDLVEHSVSKYQHTSKEGMSFDHCRYVPHSCSDACQFSLSMVTLSDDKDFDVSDILWSQLPNSKLISIEHLIDGLPSA